MNENILAVPTDADLPIFGWIRRMDKSTDDDKMGGIDNRGSSSHDNDLAIHNLLQQLQSMRARLQSILAPLGKSVGILDASG